MAKRLREAAKSYSPRAAARFVRTRAQAVLAHGKATGQFSAERESLIIWARERGLIFPRTFCDRFKPVSEGAEHVVFYDEASSLAIKTTRPNNFGHSVRRMNRNLDAFPVEYLARLAWQNALFGDDIKVLGLHCDDEGIQVITSQPWVSYDKKPLATDQQITDYFGAIQFTRAALYPHGYFFYSTNGNFAIADAGPSNVVNANDGRLVAIDVVIGSPDDAHKKALLDAETQAGAKL